MFGAVSDDFLFGAQGKDYFKDGAGNDVVFGQDGNGTLDRNEDDDRLDGGIGNDILWRGAGNDFLDAMDSRGSDDTLIAGSGLDTCSFNGFGAELSLGDVLVVDVPDGMILSIQGDAARLDSNNDGAVDDTYANAQRHL